MKGDECGTKPEAFIQHGGLMLKPSCQLPEIPFRFIRYTYLHIFPSRLRYDDFSDQEMLQIANNLPIFAVLDEDEVELTFEIMKSLVTWIRDYVEENRAILMLSFSEVNTSPKRMYVVDKGRHWNVSKQDFERNDSQLHEALVLLDKLISSAFSNR